LAVYTDVSDSELEDYLQLYDIGGLHSVKGIAEGVENTNFMITTDVGPHFLTLYEKRVHEDDLPFFLGLKEHLANKDFLCPRPIHMKSGEIIGRLAGRPSAVISFLDGISVRRPSADHCHQVGAALANMHLLAEDFTLSRANALAISSWKPLFESSGPKIDDVHKGLAKLINEELGYLEGCWPGDLPSGIIHADLFPDNVFFLKKRFSGFIDFYFACNDLLAYDLAICINAWCFEPDASFNVTKARNLLLGYVSKRPLSKLEFEALPVLCRGSALRFLLTRLYDWLNVPEGALVVPKNPEEYITKLKFHRGIERSQSYGIEFAEIGITE